MPEYSSQALAVIPEEAKLGSLKDAAEPSHDVAVTAQQARSEGSSEPPQSRIALLENKYRVVGLSAEDEAFYNNFSCSQRRNVRVKIDMRLLPVLCVLYLFAQLDRSNIGNAKIEGLKEDVNMTDTQYNIVLASFFVPYCLLGECISYIMDNKFLTKISTQRFQATCF